MKYLRVVSILFQVLIFLSCISFSQGKNQVTKQKKDSLQPSKLGEKRTIQDLHREWDSAYQAERKLPLNLMRMGPFLRDLVKRMKAAGITRTNARSQNVRKRFSTENMSVDSLGRIGIDAQFRNLNVAKLNRWLEWGVVVSSVTYPKGKLNPDVIAKLKSFGANVESIRSRSVSISCSVPFDIVEEFAKDTSMMGMQSLFPSPIHDAGIVTSKGDTILGASKARDLFYINGAGVKVGVISYGVNHWTSDTSSGDLPKSFQKLVDPNRPGDEGTAMSEIVYDIAPGANIAYADAGDKKDSMKNHVQLLKDNGCKIIVDDVVFNYEEPMFEDGDLAQKVEDVVANGVVYISSAGNSGTMVYDDIYNPDQYGYHQFIYGDDQNSLVVPDSATFVAALQWTEAWDQADEDYTFGVYYLNFQQPPGLIGTNNIQGVNSLRPQEFLQWTNTTGDSQTVHFQIGRNFTTEPANHIKIHIQMAKSRVLQWRSDIGGVIGHAANDSCISVAAANAGSPNTVASYSSHGNTAGTNIRVQSVSRKSLSRIP